jgi:hypothetical protein
VIETGFAAEFAPEEFSVVRGQAHKFGVRRAQAPQFDQVVIPFPRDQACAGCTNGLRLRIRILQAGHLDRILEVDLCAF